MVEDSGLCRNGCGAGRRETQRFGVGNRRVWRGDRAGRRPTQSACAPLGKGHCHVAVVGSTPFALAFSSMIDFSQSVRPGSILS